MVVLLYAAIFAICAIVVRINPNLINMSETERKRMDPKKTGRYAFWGMMSIALVLVVRYLFGIRHELFVPIFVIIPGILITATLVTCSIPSK